MGIFGDLMTALDLGERVVRGDVEGVKRDLLRRDPPPAAAASSPAPAPAPCGKAPAGFRCMGAHDERGNCTTLEVLEER